MKFLCLPGAYASAEVQLGPWVAEVEEDGDAAFVWTQGTYAATPPDGFKDFFGGGPHYRFFDYGGHQAFDILEKIRDFPEGSSAEETMRQLMGDGASHTAESVRRALQVLIDIIDADPDIEVSLASGTYNCTYANMLKGILGYSEGATTAASLVLEERRRLQDTGRPRRIKRAVFFAGWPPLSLQDGKVQVLLADQSESVIDIPTLHVIGCNDPYILGAMALYNMCDEDTAEIFDHGKGHTVPRDRRTVHELGDAFRRVVVKKHTWHSNSVDLKGLSIS
ncbi:duf341 domain-containing protein [Pestalotiopsis sp. NC0098]|nr:duf341 domain-containing protein [Pestalotiopsis sp. NC0098]